MAQFKFAKTSDASSIYSDTSSYTSLVEEILTPSGLKVFRFDNSSNDQNYLITPGYRYVNLRGSLLTPQWINGIGPNSHHFAEDLDFVTIYLGDRNAQAEAIVVPPLGNSTSDYTYINGAGINDSIIFLQNKAEVSSLRYNSLGISLLSTLTGNLMISGVSQFEFMDHAICLPSGSSSSNSFAGVYAVDDGYGNKRLYHLTNKGPGIFPETIVDNLDNTVLMANYQGRGYSSLDFLGGDDLLILTGLNSTTANFVSLDPGEWSMLMSNGQIYTFSNLEYIQFKDKAFELFTNGTKREIPWSDFDLNAPSAGSQACIALNDGNARFSITGTPGVGQTLTASKTSDDPDGNGSFSYSWQSSLDGTTWSAIASTNQLTIDTSQQGNKIRLQVSYTDSEGFPEEVNSEQISIPYADDGDVSFSISGNTGVGQTLTASKTSDDPDGNGSFSYSWQSSLDGTIWNELGSGLDLTIAATQEGQQIRLQVNYTDAEGFNEQINSAPVSVPYIDHGEASFSISGTPGLDQTLTALKTADDPDGNGSFSYSWQSSANGTVWDAIGTGEQLAVSSAQEGRQIRLKVNYTDADGFSEAITTVAVSVPAIPTEPVEDPTQPVKDPTEAIVPQLISADVEGNVLTLQFNSVLKATTPMASKFAVTATGKPINVLSANPSPSAGIIKLELAEGILPGESVQLEYLDLTGDQSTGVIESEDGIDIESFNIEVSNLSIDSTPPEISEATSDGTSVMVRFDEILDEDSIADVYSWKVRENGRKVTIESSAIISDNTMVELILSTPVKPRSEIDISYKDPKFNQATGVIQDAAGNDVETIRQFAVINETPLPSEPLIHSSLEVDGDKLTLFFDNELSETSPSKGSFRALVNNKKNKVMRADVFQNDNNVVLTLAKSVEIFDVVTLSYRDPDGDQKRNVIEDKFGNDLEGFWQLPVSNATSQINDLEFDLAECYGDTIDIYFNQSIATTNASAKRFKVMVYGKKQKVISVSTTNADEGIVSLTLKKEIEPGKDILLRYKDLKRDQRKGVIEDTYGNDLNSFEAAVINYAYDQLPPVVTDAFVDTGYNRLIIEFDEEISGGKLTKNRFKVKVDKKKAKVESAIIDEEESVVILDLIPKAGIDFDSLVEISHRDPKGDQSSKVVQDLFGNDLETFRGLIAEVV